MPARSRWRFLITPRWLAWHAFAILAAWGMLWLGDWQFHRAENGNALSWAYTFEWPVFVIFGVVFWVKTIADEWRHPGGSKVHQAQAGLMTRATTPNWPHTTPTWLNSITLTASGRGSAVLTDPLRLSVRAYRIMAYVTGVMLVILCFVCVPLRYFAHIPGPAEVVGAIHGVLYMIYLVVAFAMTRLVRMKVASPGTVLVLLAGTVPVLTFVVERWVSKAYIAPALAQASHSEQPVLR